MSETDKLFECVERVLNMADVGVRLAPDIHRDWMTGARLALEILRYRVAATTEALDSVCVEGAAAERDAAIARAIPTKEGLWFRRHPGGYSDHVVSVHEDVNDAGRKFPLAWYNEGFGYDEWSGVGDDGCWIREVRVDDVPAKEAERLRVQFDAALADAAALRSEVDKWRALGLDVVDVRRLLRECEGALKIARALHLAERGNRIAAEAELSRWQDFSRAVAVAIYPRKHGVLVADLHGSADLPELLAQVACVAVARDAAIARADAAEAEVKRLREAITAAADYLPLHPEGAPLTPAEDDGEEVRVHLLAALGGGQ